MSAVDWVKVIAGPEYQESRNEGAIEALLYLQAVTDAWEAMEIDGSAEAFIGALRDIIFTVVDEGKDRVTATAYVAGFGEVIGRFVWEATATKGSQS